MGQDRTTVPFSSASSTFERPEPGTRCPTAQNAEARSWACMAPILETHSSGLLNPPSNPWLARRSLPMTLGVTLIFAEAAMAPS